MTFPKSRPDRLPKKSSRKNRPLGVEKLEDRMMNAFSGLEQNLQLLLSPGSLGSTQLVSSTRLGTNIKLPPTIQSQARLASGTEVRGTTSTLTIQADDDLGENNLTYRWYQVNGPAGGRISFSVNGTNESKQTTATFNKAGVYTIQVRVQDSDGMFRTSDLRINVIASVTNLKVFSSNGLEIPPEVTVAGKSANIIIRGFDQFGDVMSALPNASWNRVAVPGGANPSTVVTTRDSRITFNSLGNHVMQFRSGNTSLNVQFNVTPVFTSIAVRDASGRLLPPGLPVMTPGGPQQWSATALDQFGNAMSTQPTINWNQTVSPSGSSTVFEVAGNTASASFNRVGLHRFTASVGAMQFQIPVMVSPVLSQIILEVGGERVDPLNPLTTTTASQRISIRGLDQFGQSMPLPSLTWSTTSGPAGGNATGSISSTGVATVNFSGSGMYALRVRGGNASADFRVNVVRTVTSLVQVNAQGGILARGAALVTSGTSVSTAIRALDQFGRAFESLPSIDWTNISSPGDGAASLTVLNGQVRLAFTKIGSYGIRGVAGNASLQLSVRVTPTLTRLQLTPNQIALKTGETQQFTVSGLDQFGHSTITISNAIWRTSGGSISSRGLFTAGAMGGNFTVTATASGFSASAQVIVNGTTPQNTLVDTNLNTLVQSLNADQTISRNEMIQILRSVGNDGVVSATELNDLRRLVTTDSGFMMPAYVRELARDVVNSNPANLRFKGQTAGNLSAGSPASLLNNLIDKWFLGADEPTVLGAGITYQLANGVLFSGNPTRTDARQGYIGDCYFIAAITSIADANADAVRNMFLDNGDGTFTVRFFDSASAEDYVTVNRRLPAFSNGTLAYAGVGNFVTNSGTILWVALAEKAYAQWNETGKAGRDGTNSYAGIEGGWMSNVNRQILGFNSTNLSLATTTKQQLINSLGGGRAVTIGTKSTSQDGLVGSHAYTVTEYNATTDRFTLYNPWGMSHPAPLSWAQLQANCSLYTVTVSGGTSAISTNSVRSTPSVKNAVNWYVVEVFSMQSPATEATIQESVEALSEPIDLQNHSIQQPTYSDWTTPPVESYRESEEDLLRELSEITTDILMSEPGLGSLFG
jgi:hypothetical protein